MKSHQILKQYFERKKEMNRAYSLRALSRDINLSPSFLSEVFSGRKKIPVQVLKKLIKPLDLDEPTLIAIRKALLLESLPDIGLIDEFKKSSKSSSVQNYKPLSTKKLSLLHKWYYVAVLDLITCNHFKSDIPWISRRLGLLQTETQEALQLLTNLDLIEIKDSMIRKKSNRVRISAAKSQKEVRQFHQQMIGRSLNQLQFKTSDTDFERRLIAGITLSADPKKIKKAKQKLNDVLHEIAQDLMDGECTEVYQLNFQLFPLTTSTGAD